MSISTLRGLRRVHVHTAAGMCLDPPPDFDPVLITVVLADIQPEPCAGDLEAEDIRSRFRTAVLDTKVRLWGHTNSNCRVAIVGLEGGTYAITGVPFLST